MLTFIKANGVYIGFWLFMLVVGLVGLYFAVKWGVRDAIQGLDL